MYQVVGRTRISKDIQLTTQWQSTSEANCSSIQLPSTIHHNNVSETTTELDSYHANNPGGGSREVHVTENRARVKPEAATIAKPDKYTACKKVDHSALENSEGWKNFTSALELYRQFHGKQMKLLREISAQLDDNGGSDIAKIRTLTWSCDKTATCSGLGDQFYRIEFVLLLAIMSDRVFTIYWNEENLKAMKYIKPNQINWDFYDERLGMHKEHDMNVSNFLEFREPEFSKLVQLLKSDVPHITITHEMRVGTDNAYKVAIEDPYIGYGLARLGIRGKLTFLNEAGNIFLGGKILRYLFTFSRDVISQVERAEKQMGIFKRKYVAVHLRTGFVGTKFQEEVIGEKKGFKQDKWENILRGSLEIADKKIGNQSLIYLATDSYTAKEWAVQYSKRIKVIDMKLQHIAVQESWYNTTTRMTDYNDGFMATWIDLLLLARAQILVHGISGFSIAAGSFCSIPLTRRISMELMNSGTVEI